MEQEPSHRSEDLGLLPIGKTLPILLVRAREVALSYWRDRLADMDFTEQQWRVLRVTAELGPLDISNLSHQTALHMPSVTRILQTLEKRGYVTRQRDEADSRRSWIAVTDKTRAKMASAADHSKAVYSEITTNFDDEKMQDLIRLLTEFSEIRK